jgi:hypothetical protein
MIYNKENGCRIKPTETSDKLIGRIKNAKFESALQYMKGQPRDIQQCLRSLNRLHGNSGWVMGDYGTLLGLAIDALIGSERKISSEGNVTQNQRSRPT